MARKKKTTSVRVRQPFAAYGQVWGRGTVLDAKHPVVKGREHLFEEVAPVERVEQATAAPGEVRNVTPPKKEEEPAEEVAEDEGEDA